jgi:hypothetical protein
VAPDDWLDDLGRSRPWPEGFWECLDSYRQGHVIDAVPLFFLESGNFEIWDQPRRRIVDGPLTIAGTDDAGATVRAMIITQACDIMKAKNPWVTAVPVYEASTRLRADVLPLVKAGGVLYLIPLTAEWCGDDLWVADLRLEMPLEKARLALQEPIEAFAEEVDYAKLAQRLRDHRGRAAAPDNCVDHVSKPLSTLILAAPGYGASLLSGVREIRLSWDDPSAASVVTVYVIKRGEEPVAEADWNAVLDELRQTAHAQGITVNGPEIVDLYEMTAADYLASAPFDHTVS